MDIDNSMIPYREETYNLVTVTIINLNKFN